MQKHLNKNLFVVLNVIPQGDAHKVTLSDIQRLTGLDKRTVSSCIETLRTQFFVPIVSDRSKIAGGVYIAQNEAERQQGIVSFKRQMNSMQFEYEALQKASLTEWRQNITPTLIRATNKLKKNIK